jgi:hypothetical protein
VVLHVDRFRNNQIDYLYEEIGVWVEYDETNSIPEWNKMEVEVDEEMM